VGMAALFAGCARALLTSIVFALESTMQESTLLPLLAGCVTSYMVSFILMRGTIMTEKIKRKGVIAPEHFVPDLLEITRTEDFAMPVDTAGLTILSPSMKIRELRAWLEHEGFKYAYNTLFVAGANKSFLSGTIDRKRFLEKQHDEELAITSLMSRKVYSVYSDNSLKLVVDFMLKTRQDILPVFDRSSRHLTGFISQYNVLKSFEERFRHEQQQSRHISMWSETKGMIHRGRTIFRR
jgi:hypothetical protein